MRITRVTTLLAAGALAATGLAGAGSPAQAARPLTPASTFTMDVHQDGSVTAPTDGSAIPNIDSVKSTLRAYYGATKGPDPAHAFSELAPATTYLPDLVDSPYAKNTEAVADRIDAALPDAPASNAAVVFDVDSTLLSDYANEEDMRFNYSVALNGVWVDHQLFPAVAGMPELLRTLHAQGYRIYGITGRPAGQETATLGNLTKAGYTSDGTASGTPLFDAGTLYTKDLANQAWVDCTADGSAATACSTVEYKALTRKHIQDTDDVTIVMNVGDQWSDLEGGYATATQKVPNPSYFLPSADIAGAPGSDAAMVLPRTYRMKPDGSSGATATDGDAIPNEGAVVRLIRAYYNATDGVADKTSSPYISQLRKLTRKWAATVAPACRTAVRKHQHPAAVFDVDDTTLWTYDMEDAAMGFAFDPALQDTWVQGQRFPAVPGMVRLVAKVKRAGCTIVGLTGRSTSQGKATVKNLAKVGYRGFTARNFFFKPDAGDRFPRYLGCRDCTTIQYKAGTRAYLEKRRHLKVVANFGDQFSDLKGGHAKKSIKLPNPTYYLP